MAKKSSSFKALFSFIAIALAIASVILVVATSLNYNDKITQLKFTGIETIFGYKYKYGDIPYLGFSFLCILPYAFAILGIVFSLIDVFLKKRKTHAFIEIIFLIVAGVLFFTTKSLINIGEISSGGITIKTLDSKSFSLAVGSILSGIFCCVSAFLLLVNLIIDKKK